MRLPPGVLPPHLTRTFLLVHSGCRTYRDLMAATGLSRAGIALRLRVLRDLGLVEWEPGHQHTLRPSVKETS